MSSLPTAPARPDPNRAVLLVAVALSAFSVGLSSVLVGWTAWTKDATAPVAALHQAPRPTIAKRVDGPRDACAVLASRSN